MYKDKKAIFQSLHEAKLLGERHTCNSRNFMGTPNQKLERKTENNVVEQHHNRLDENVSRKATENRSKWRKIGHTAANARSEHG